MTTLDRLSKQHLRAALATVQRIRQDAKEGLVTPESLKRDMAVLSYHRLTFRAFQHAAEHERSWLAIPSMVELRFQNENNLSNSRIHCCNGDRISCARVASVHDSSQWRHHSAPRLLKP